MSVPVGELIARTDSAVTALGLAPSTLWQYRWAWSQVELFCSQRGDDELTDEITAEFLGFVEGEHGLGRIKDWKRKLLRKAVLECSRKNGGMVFMPRVR